MMILILQIVIFVALVVASGFFSSSETALFSLDPHEVNRIGETQPHLAEKIRTLLQAPTRLLSTILIGNTLVNVWLWIVGARLMAQFGVEHELVQMALLTLLTLLFGEFGPKRIAILYYRKLAWFYAPPLTWCVRAFKWPRAGLEAITNRFSSKFRPSGHILSQPEWDTLMEASGESGDLDEHEHRMVQAILSLERQKAGDVMTPRVDLEGVDLTEPETDLAALARDSGVRHLVLYREQLDDIEGLLDVKSFLLDPTRDPDAATQGPFFVPEVCTLDKLLAQMLATQRRVAVVVDEYGGTAGLITRGDILEELTGEMDTEDADRLVCEQLTEDTWLLDGQMHLLDVQRETGLSLESETADRLAGWFIEQTDHIPRVGERIAGEGYKAMVRQMRRNRVLLIILQRMNLDEEEGL